MGVGRERARLLGLSPVYLDNVGGVGDMVAFTSGSSMFSVEAKTGACMFPVCVIGHVFMYEV